MKNSVDLSSVLKNKGKLFFLGIGGVSMSALALTAKSFGCSVSGHDSAVNQTTKLLEDAGIPVYSAFDKSHYEGVDLVVYTGAVKEDDIVFSYPKNLGLPFVSRSVFLGYLMKQSKNPIGVSGTHGKSSTTGMISSIFSKEENRDHTVMAGAVLPELDGTYRLGKDEDFIFEACEYQNSFLDFFPHIAVILNVEHDHADFFPTLEDVIESFVKFSNIAKEGYAVINLDNEGAVEVGKRSESTCFYFSKKQKADLWCENLQENKGFYSFDIMTKKGLFTSVTLSVPGEHNVENALAAASAAYLSGVSPKAIKEGLEAFGGVRRRFEYRGMCNGFKVFDDYAHHPDEIRATLTSAKKLGYENTFVVFQSHTFTRTQAYWQDFVSALSIADKVIIADIYPAREKPLPGITAENMAKENEKFSYLGDFDAIAKHLLSLHEKGLLLIMGAGTIVDLTDLILTDK